MLLKLCDISNVVRSFEDAQEWAKLLNAEFIAMGRLKSGKPEELIPLQQKAQESHDQGKTQNLQRNGSFN